MQIVDGILWDEAYVITVYLPALSVGECESVLPEDGQLVRLPLYIVGEDVQYSTDEDGLAAAGLARYAEQVVRADIQIKVMDDDASLTAYI